MISGRMKRAGVGRLALRALFIALLAFVTYMTLTPSPEDTKSELMIARWISNLIFGSGIFGDKVAHVLAYAALGLSALTAGIAVGGRKTYTLVALALYGMALEGLQGLGGVRVAETFDALANASGAFAGAAVYYAAAFLARVRRA